ncbi:general stress protein [Pseudalgibacter alginicilyticus]|uniref:General stress protein n=1 Tax=Pseudalgibacter alginicilyticus TaxID=1736674 RepID=A0A0P0D7G5_9FLAO|nr:pyridoxamine 5'-phosphate oxidase family protein [Pseudalgibacter alginicilyticus]ALJ03695.1 general stress protein [Pseudalgibacter alginicilyticus]
MNTNKYNIKGKEKLEKISKLIQEPKVVMLLTALNKTPVSVSPMTIQEIDEQGDIWFFSSKESSHFTDIEFDNKVQIIYVDNTNQTYISMYGNATHIVDKMKVVELWNSEMNNWFDDKDDSNLVLLNVNIDTAHYWNSNDKRLVSF